MMELQVRPPLVETNERPNQPPSAMKKLFMHASNAVLSPPRASCRHDAASASASVSNDKVYLKSIWTSSTFRHPLLRLLVCLLRIGCCFFLAMSSPLMTSLHTPAYFPIYSTWLSMVMSLFSGHLPLVSAFFHLMVTMVMIVLIRYVVYRKLLQHQWNWQSQSSEATTAYHRNSGIQRPQESPPAPKETLMLQCTPYKTCKAPVRLQMLNSARANGSWTILMTLVPVVWTSTMVLMTALGLGNVIQLFPIAPILSHVAQWQWEDLLYQFLMVVNTLVLIMTMDQLLQDQSFCTHVYQDWWSCVRSMYTRHPMVRLVVCYCFVIGLFVISFFLNGWTWLRVTWIHRNLQHLEVIAPWLSNESWRSMLSGVLVALDLVWLLQDWTFPHFGSIVHIRSFGCWSDQLQLSIKSLRLVFTSKWSLLSLMLGVILPLDLCQFVQVVTYTPSHYEQMAQQSSHRLIPVLSSSSSGIQLPDVQLVTDGSLCRYFGWPWIDRLPSVLVLGSILMVFLWLWKKEQPRLCFSTFVGQLHKPQLATAIHQTLSSQHQLSQLYALRAQMDFFCTILTLLAVLTVSLQLRSLWIAGSAVSGPLQSPGETYGVVLVLLSVLLLYQLMLRYQVKRQILVLRNHLPASCSSLLKAPVRWLLLPFLLELVVNGLCVPPLMHYSLHVSEPRFFLHLSAYSITKCPPRMVLDHETEAACDLNYQYPLEILNLVVLLRLYWLVRVLRNHFVHRLVSDPVLIVSGLLQKIPQMDSLVWNLRIWLSFNPTRVLLGLFLLLASVSAAFVSIAERPFPSLLDHEDHSLWLIIVTMSGVGYGDVYPMTAVGRTLVFFGAVFGGNILHSLLTSVFLESLHSSKAEQTFVLAMEKIQWQQQIWTTSARLIATAWRHRHHITKSRPVFSLAHEFKLLRKRKPKQCHSDQDHVTQLRRWKQHQLQQSIRHYQQETNVALTALEHELDRLEQTVVLI